ncbi:PilZ domain-containing protein [Rhizobium sp. SGZ-381]|uniref:PilZ domain-containing protein n=1 Tax=Rhizobium sp. SGZ-381 TaxID=3342800 RepID=UPI0036716CC2
MSGKSSLKFVSVSLLAILAGCNSSGTSAGLTPAQPAAAPVAPVVQAYCPPVVLRDETAVRSSYTGNAKEDPDKLIYRASLADATRACTANEATMTINVVAQGRLILGPAGKSGRVTLPILVEVVDGDNVIYSQKVSYPVDVPAEGSTQFIFNKADVSIPNTAASGDARFTRVRLGFDDGSVAKPARKKR